ncbi:hypothetical protein FHX58_006278 [Paraburkholderia tropica]|nr:hypothetical protein [Paraburkholderia tropica]
MEARAPLIVTAREFDRLQHASGHRLKLFVLSESAPVDQ